MAQLAKPPTLDYGSSVHDLNSSWARAPLSAPSLLGPLSLSLLLSLCPSPTPLTLPLSEENKNKNKEISINGLRPTLKQTAKSGQEPHDRKVSGWQTGIRSDAHCQMSAGGCKWNHKDMSLRVSRKSSSLKYQFKTLPGMGSKKELSFTAGGNANRSSRFGKQPSLSLQDWTSSHHRIQQLCSWIFTQISQKLTSTRKPIQECLQPLSS